MQPAEHGPAPNVQARQGKSGSGWTRRILKPAAFAVILAAQPALAEEPPPKLSLELNSLAPTESGCRVTFLISNAMGTDIEKVAFEIALFDKDHFVDRLTVIEFTDLPAEKSKVSQFDFPGANCANISRVLVNGITECGGGNLDAGACTSALATSTRTQIEFGS